MKPRYRYSHTLKYWIPEDNYRALHIIAREYGRGTAIQAMHKGIGYMLGGLRPATHKDGHG